MKSIEIPFQQWLHVVRATYHYTNQQEYLKDGFAHMIGVTFSYAVECRYEFMPFVKKFLCSDTFKYFGQTPTMYSHSPYHVLAGFDGEMMAEGKRCTHLDEEQVELREVAYWLGYFLMEWHLCENVSGEYLAEKYDINWLIEQYMSGRFAECSIKKAIHATKAKFDFSVLSEEE